MPAATFAAADDMSSLPSMDYVSTRTSCALLVIGLYWFTHDVSQMHARHKGRMMNACLLLVGKAKTISGPRKMRDLRHCTPNLHDLQKVMSYNQQKSYSQSVIGVAGSRHNRA